MEFGSVYMKIIALIMVDVNTLIDLWTKHMVSGLEKVV
jgi:hypothetical protein